MQIKRTLSFNKAIIINIERMRQLDDLLLSFFSDVEYTSILKNGNKEVHENIESLLSSDNYKNERIVALDIYARDKEYDNDDVAFLSLGRHNYISLLFEYSEVCTGSYCFSNREDADKFEKQLKAILDKSTASYWIIAKISFSVAFCIICLLAYFYLIISGNSSNHLFSVTQGNLLLIVILCMIIVFLVFTFNRIIHGTILPPTSFVWGEEEQWFSRMEKWRSGLFWSVIVALGISLV